MKPSWSRLTQHVLPVSKVGLGSVLAARPDVAVITAVGSEHHRSLGTLEVTRAEKSWMVQALPAAGVAVLNGDDPNVMWMRQKTRARVVTFGFGAACDVRADDVRLDWPRGTRKPIRAPRATAWQSGPTRSLG